MISEEELYCDADEVNLNNLVIDDPKDSPTVEDYDDLDEYNSEEYEEYDDDDKPVANTFRANPQQSTFKPTNFQTSDNLMTKYSNKINLNDLPRHATNLLVETQKRIENNRIRTKDKRDRATVEKAIDGTTRIILFKLLDRNIISEINGCISTGKEANVYYASLNSDKEFAIKVYKTSILEFKDRQKYVEGEFRYRHGYCKHNPRKMVRTWAEKEMRNLRRMFSNGINVPEPILLRSHVLLMRFVGKNGWPAPILKDVELNQSKARKIYREIVVILWKMYNVCKLVHGDLSEFNIMYHNGEVCIIDVSQSVEHDHPRAFDFLRSDCKNITDFFQKKGVATMTVKELFIFTTDPSINEDNMEECLDKLSELASERTEMTSSEQVFLLFYY